MWYSEELLAGCYFTGDDGYLGVEHFTDSADDESGELICLVDAGDTVLDVLRKIVEYKRKLGTEGSGG